MEIKELKRISISNLILVILNNKNNDSLRKYAEIELKRRIRNVGWKYDDLLHFDDKVIKERGFEIDNYLISPNVNMQQLIETYFMYNHDNDYNSNYLLFSEKHLCNEADLFEPFFRKICAREIKNIDKICTKEILNSNKEYYDTLMLAHQKLLFRQQKAKQVIRDAYKFDPIEILCANEAMCQLNAGDQTSHEFLYNINDEEKYKLLSSKLGMMKVSILEILNDSLFDYDLMQYLAGLKFVLNDSSKLNKQKRQLLQQVRSGYVVDYESDSMQKTLIKRKK